MPSLTLRYAVTDEFRLRFNYGETLRRPDFTDLNPNFALTEDLTGVGYGTGTGGNPDLEAAKAKNYDLTAEWYFAEDSAIYGTLFRRDIEGLVVPLTRRITIPGTGLNTDDVRGDAAGERVGRRTRRLRARLRVLPRSAGLLQRPRSSGQLHAARFRAEHPADGFRPAHIIGQETS